uniref:SET domain-containing protein n=1 Tax=Fagus sylvatica TaxID=28930 RepID=A0A2N9IS52_FAGSY
MPGLDTDIVVHKIPLARMQAREASTATDEARSHFEDQGRGGKAIEGSEDPTRRLEQMASLATALTTTRTEFSNELTYMPGMASRSANRAVLELGGMQVLSKEDTETLNLCQSMMERGEWPPLMVVFDPQEGERGEWPPSFVFDPQDRIALFWHWDGKKKQNLKCVRFDVNGQGRVLLIANRDIRKGERLYYDYNGYENEYPTEHFV